MIEANPYLPQEVKRAYNRRSGIYNKTMVPMEWDYHLQALNLGNIQPGEKILEVATGPGRTLLEIASRVGKETPIYGMDISTRMLQLTEQRLQSNGFSRFELKEGDARNLPFGDNTFDALYNGYMLDLIPEADMPGILAEFRRVLRPGGRIILLNMSKASKAETVFREKLYRILPPKFVLYVMGGCRPVLMEDAVRQAGFQDVQRTFIGGKAPSEIILAVKPHKET